MADINIVKDCKLIDVIASQARHERIDTDVANEANEIVSQLVTDLTPGNRHKIAQTIGYAVEKLQNGSLDFLSRVADVKNIGYGDKAAFNVRTGGVHAYIQAKGSTTARSFISDRQVKVDTEEISARPAINILDLRTGRINIADIVNEANKEIENMKLRKIETVLHGAIDDYSSPFYASGTGIVKATLDAQIAYFRRLGPVTILGDEAAVAQLQGIAGMTSAPYVSDTLIDEYNNKGYIGKYIGCDVVAMPNAYLADSSTPVLATDWLYIVPGNLSADGRNLKVVNEGGISAFESQNIDDMVFEVRLDQMFGAAFVSAKIPTIGAYKIN